MKCILVSMLAVSLATTAALASDGAPASAGVTPAPAIWQKVEAELQKITMQIAERRKVLISQNAEISAKQKAIDAARAELEQSVAKLPSVQSIDAAHRERLKEYGAQEARFNSLRSHWTTHNKAAVGTNGLAVSAPRPLPGCQHCQKDFERFVKGDAEVVEGYRIAAEKLLSDMAASRGGLMRFTVTRRDAINAVVGADPNLSQKAKRIESMDRELQDAIGADVELAALVKQRDACRAQLKELGEQRRQSVRQTPVKKT